MENLDIAVVGSGIGSALISALNKDKNIVVFEKDSNLGGCASTFKRYGSYFNTGATTFVGYEDGHIIKDIFDKAQIKPDIIESKIAIRTIQNGKKLDRIQNFEEFLYNLNQVYYHKNNRIFWKTIYEIDRKFWELKGVFYGKYTFKNYLETAFFVKDLIKNFGFDLLKSADSFIQETLPNISNEYRAFIDSQLLITLQTTSKNASLLSMSLGLSYPFHRVFYVQGGMSSIIENIFKDVQIQKNEEVLHIKRDKEKFFIETAKGDYLASKVILNSTIFDSSKLFEEKEIKNYFDKFSFGNQSAFVVYLKLKIKKPFLHHYQIILKQLIPNTISNSFFVSFSDENDEKLSQNGLSVTISTHSNATFWEGIGKEQYEEKKEQTQNFILKEFLNYFDDISKDDIDVVFSATSKTFYRFINRSNCGGRPINIKSVFSLPSCNTPFEGLYNVGDTVFAGQGWPGIAIGVDVLNKMLHQS